MAVLSHIGVAGNEVTDDLARKVLLAVQANEEGSSGGTSDETGHLSGHLSARCGLHRVNLV